MSKSGHAVVLGASIGGLLAARVLSDSFETVSVFDRDTVSAPPAGRSRKGTPQADHPHGLLARGRAVLEELFPGVLDDLAAEGAIVLDVQQGGVWIYRDRPVPRAPGGFTGVCVSRPGLEAYVRRRVGALANVTVFERHEATGLLHTAGRVTGATVRPVDAGAGGERDVAADLVVDATGRGNRGPTWLAALGYDRPAEDRVDPVTTYVSAEFRRTPGSADFGAILNAATPYRPYGAIMIAVEGDRWTATAFGVGPGHVPPTERAAFVDFFATLPDPRAHRVLAAAEMLTEPTRLRLPTSVRRRYEDLPRLPEGLIAFGDAICAFNPSYGQGMAVAAAEAIELRDALAAGRDGLPRRFYAKAATIVGVAWDLSVGGDLAHAAVQGERTARVRMINGYVDRVLRAAERDAVVANEFMRVAHLLQPPRSLFAPRVVGRVLLRGHRRGGSVTATPVAARP